MAASAPALSGPIPAEDSLQAKFAGVRAVTMPPTWKPEDPAVYTFSFFHEDLTRDELQAFFTLATKRGVPNPRPVSRSLIELASLFHPLLYEMSISGGVEGAEDFFADMGRGVWLGGGDAGVLATPRRYLQSLVFLAGCTLSAAVIQNRYSPGNIDSKLGRLWQTAQYARRGLVEGIDPAELEQFVRDCSARTDEPYLQLIDLKKAYGRTLGAIGAGIEARPAVVRASPLDEARRARFAGIPEVLRELTGNEVECILAYGSAVTSDTFADYDLIVVVRDAARALWRLRGADPEHRGRELNCSIYDRDDFTAFQRCSGDNLDRGVLCLYGEAEVPVKPRADLLFRNFSFAFIRLRQLLGMAAFLAREGVHANTATTASLYNYFVKIPMHIVKGVRGSMGDPNAKEKIEAEMLRELEYDLRRAAAQCLTGDPWRAISDAYHATHATIGLLNAEYRAFRFEEGRA